MNKDISAIEKSTPALAENISDEKNTEETEEFVESVEKQEEGKRVEQHEALQAGARALAEKADAFVDIATVSQPGSSHVHPMVVLMLVKKLNRVMSIEPLEEMLKSLR